MPTRVLVPMICLVAALGAALAGCGPATTQPTASVPTTAPPSLALPISTAEDAMAAVVVAAPRFAAIPPKDLDLIGQSKWWEARPASGVGAFVVMITVGWGDCQAGCIDQHRWTYAVTPDGGVRLLAEDGAPVPPDVLPAEPGAGTGITGHAMAGPVCPVETNPPDPACAPRPVVDAEIVVRDETGAQVGATRSATDGTFTIELEPGRYVVEGRPVEGLMGAPQPAEAVVAAGGLTDLELAYDTGIR